MLFIFIMAIIIIFGNAKQLCQEFNVGQLAY